MSAFIKVLILLQFIHLFLPNIAPSSVPKFSIINEKIDTNSSNITSGCQAKISESGLKFILELMRDKITHVIDLHIWIESVNNTTSKTRVPTRIKWANEIGRTLVSLIAQAEKSDDMMLLSYTSTLKAGIHSMKIVVSEEAMRCFTSRHNTSDHDLFDLLVQQLHHITGSKAAYKWCHVDKGHVETYNCCAVVGPNDALICSDYSSVVTKMSPILVWIFVAFILYISFPVAQEYLNQFAESDAYCRISNSPMSLSFILYLAFIEGHGPVKSFARKIVFALFMVVTTLPEYGSIVFFCYVGFVGLWLLFLFKMEFNFNEHAYLNAYLKPIEIVTLPLNIKKFWKDVSEFTNRSKKYISISSETESDAELKTIDTQENVEDTSKPLSQHEEESDDKLITIDPQENVEDTSQPLSQHEKESDAKLITTDTQENVGNTSQPLSQHEKEKKENVKELSFIERMKKRFLVLAFLIFYLIMIPILSLGAFAKLIGHNWNFVKEQVSSDENSPKKVTVNAIFLMIFIVITYVFIGFSAQNLFPFVLYFIFGLFLNGEFYTPYILPLSTIIFFSWTKWRSSVETKYLVLITNIYKVCKESHVESDECSHNGNKNSKKCHKIKQDRYGNPMIAKKLYHLVREELLPYDRILFAYFQGVFFIAIFAFILYILMSLAQRSHISGSVQVIGTIAATSLPFIFDFVWKKKSDEQKEADSVVLKSNLKRILRVHSSDDITRVIEVEFERIKAKDKIV